jgi:predicted transcriptional regulator
MTLTVRLPQPLEKALDAYSAEKGLTKSHVVQEALAEYLVHATDAQPPARNEGVSEAYRAMKKAGLIGCVSGMNGESATKDVVRRKVLESLKRPR